ncbi:MFS transporter [Amycolatopsis alkalitolerans]|uniref:MFS transporter n=1 Tax=Amycolatopsis alkalitolerans TaxID=2547244 RepID=A0A5C4LTS3_9PSEU|nr:MFS transporter [Amycolatopsis alkalitolerans]TNC21396.1 MFS transporter [Amycolatopsis alkalitolerans]
MATMVETGQRRRALGFFAICLGNFVIMLDTNIVNLAVPHIRSSLGGSLGTLLWVVNGYTLTVAALILSGGAIGDRLGNDRAYRLGVLGFAITSLICGLAPNLALLILFRVLQGVSAARDGAAGRGRADRHAGLAGHLLRQRADLRRGLHPGHADDQRYPARRAREARRAGADTRDRRDGRGGVRVRGRLDLRLDFPRRSSAWPRSGCSRDDVGHDLGYFPRHGLAEFDHLLPVVLLCGPHEYAPILDP